MIKSTFILLRNFFFKKNSIWSLFPALTSYTVERLKKNPNVAHIHNSTLVECICGKRVVLHRAYEETNLTKHLQNGCNLKNNIMLQVKFVYFYQV